MIQTLFASPILFIISAVSLLLAIDIHEFSHALAADKLGDPTPRLQGRLSLNPLVHIDLAGLAFLLFFGFGWGKPVTFDPYNLKNPRRDAAIISIAGPISNILLALVISIALRLSIAFAPSVAAILYGLTVPFVWLNVMLAVFNLIPIHPLDGFKIVGGLLSRQRAQEWYGLERYGFIFLLLLIIPIGSSSMVQAFLQPVVSFIVNLLIPSGGAIYTG